MASYDVWKLDCPPENKPFDFEVEKEEYQINYLDSPNKEYWDNLLEGNWDDEPWEEDLNPLTAEDLKYLYN